MKMVYRPFGNSGIVLSIIGLGGHEYLPDGSSRGFHEDRRAAVRPGYMAKGYGGRKRMDLLRDSFEHGINFFDVTIDPEKEALGRNLKEMAPPYEIFIQTRPEGMGYGYDPGNRKMADLKLLRAEVQRILRLMQRECVEILNLPFLRDALDQDPEYLQKMGHNVAELKREGLIRFASADTFSGEQIYLEQIRSGQFDSVVMNFNIVADSGLARVIPEAIRAKMAVVTREAFLKGGLFHVGQEAGIEDRDLLARLAVKYNANALGVTSAIIGAETPVQFRNALSALNPLSVSHDEEVLMEKLRATTGFKERHKQHREEFLR